jgi:hypothetical protein
MNVDGTYVPHMLILPSKNMKPELMDGAPFGATSSYHPPGYIQQHILTEQFQLFLSFAKPRDEDPAVSIRWMLLAH